MASGQASEFKKLDEADDSDDFDAATDLCDFGFVLAQPVVMKAGTEKRPEVGG